MAGQDHGGEIAFITEDKFIIGTGIAVPSDVLGVDQQVIVAVAVPVRQLNLSPSAVACFFTVEAQGVAFLIKKDPFSRFEDQPAVFFFPFKITQISFVIDYDQVIQPVIIQIHHYRACAPFHHQFFRAGVPPVPVRFGRGAGPLHPHGPGGVQHRFPAGAGVGQPDDFSGDAVEDDIGQAVHVPVGHVGDGIAPFGFGRALDGHVLSGHDAKYFSPGLQPYRRGPAGRGAPAQVLKEFQKTGGISGDNVFVTISVPVKTAGSGQHAAFNILCFLSEIYRRCQNRFAVFSGFCIFNINHPAVFHANKDIRVAVIVPVIYHHLGHLQLQMQDMVVHLQETAGSICRCGAGARIFKEGDPVQELTAEQVVVAVSVPVGQVG